jgi:solute:Na+ symporter, SSS family
VSVIGSVVGSLATEPEDDSVLEKFYRQVRPWGFWGPVVANIRKADPAFEPNKEFGRDMVNVAVAIPCQFMLVTAPIYFVLKNWTGVFASLAVFLVTAAFLKKSWFDKIEA